MDGSLGEGQVFAAFQHLFHHLGGLGCPAAVFHQGDGAVLEVSLRQVIDVFPHEGEDVRIVGGGGQNQSAVAEGILHGFRHVVSGQVKDHNLGTALFHQLALQKFDRLFGMAVDGGVGDDDALALHSVGGPGVVKVQVVAQVLL